ncbi:MAG: SDR family oxidoreductase [Verrucomicrobiales bacterium]|nr:SDR family oxidoreductase [Verrucomicrobiales bacterium]
MAIAAKRVLIVGCGYVGTALGRRLAGEGHAVIGLRRSPPDPTAVDDSGIQPWIGDLTRRDSLDSLPGPFDWVINTVSSSRGGPAEYRAVYRDGMRHLLDWMRAHPPSAFAYTSSTSVYGQTSGDWVDESSPTIPSTETGEILLEAERLILDAAAAGTVPGRILRVAGIYGPGRGHLLRQFLRGEARIHGTGARWINMIHRDDAAGALIAALARGRPGELYNAVDDEPVSQLEFLTWLSERLQRPLPPVASEEELATRKRGLTHKRVRNQKLRSETGWNPSYPTFREGYAAELKR